MSCTACDIIIYIVAEWGKLIMDRHPIDCDKRGITMTLHVQQATLAQQDDNAFTGNVVFKLEGYNSLYEISFFSKNGRDWDYSLHFTAQSGNEEEYLKLDAQLEHDDELFDALLDAALQSAEQ